MMLSSRLHRILLVCLASVVLFAAGGNKAHAQQVGLKMNALMYALGTPNLGCELMVKEHSSVDITLMGHYKPYTIDSKFIAIQPEYRFWFNGRPMVREFVGVSAMFASYDMNIRNYIYDGLAASLGIVGGYAFMLNRDWRLELCGGLSLLYFHQKQYYETDEFFVDPAARANSWGYKLFPAKLGVTFTYIIK